MTEQRVPAEGVGRVNVELQRRDLDVSWSQSQEIVVHGDDVVVEEQSGTVFVAGQGRGGGIHVGVGQLFVGLEGAGEGGRVRLELPESLPELDVRVRTGDLTLADARGRCELRVERGDVTLRRGQGSATITVGGGDVRVEDYQGPVAVQGGAGSKRLLRVEGAVSVTGGSGDLELIGGTGNSALMTGSGDIELRDRRCEGLSIKAGSGDVRVDGGAAGRLQVMTGSGDVICETVLGADRQAITTGSGDITLGFPRGLAARLEITTARGKIDSQLPLVEVGQRGKKSLLGRRLVGSVGEGDERADISLRAASGDITLRWLAVAEPVAVAAAPPPAPGPAPAPTQARPAEPREIEPDRVPEPSTPIAAPPPAPHSAGATADPRRAILEALSHGSITPAEAARLLDALEGAA